MTDLEKAVKVRNEAWALWRIKEVEKDMKAYEIEKERYGYERIK